MAHGFQVLQIRNLYSRNTYFAATESIAVSRCWSYRKYDSCMSCSKVTSYWRPLDGTSPYIGNVGEISCEPEMKVEVTVFTEKVDETIQVIKEVHPYEEPVINALPIYRTSF